jgi:hypothetical protein
VSETVEQPSPNMLYQGQLYSRETAAAEIARLDADKDFVAAALGGDVAAQQLRRDFWLMARGHQPGGVPATPSDGTGVQQQMNEREEQIQEARLGVWQKHIRMDDTMKAELRRSLATAEQVDDAKREIRRMLADPEFGAKVLRGDMDAKDRWHRFNLISAMQVAPENYDWSKDKL